MLIKSFPRSFKMFVSDIEVAAGSNHKIETKTDLVWYIECEETRERFLDTFGDLEVVWDEEYQTWRVPAFNEVREKYIAHKVEQCARWGCN